MARTQIALLAAAGAGLSACAATKPLYTASSETGLSRCPPASACAPSNSALRQYFDASRHRYYYYDPITTRYYWENGSPKS